MATKIAPTEHPGTAIALHWAHLLSFAVLVYTGVQIHAAPHLAGTQADVGTAHKPAMLVFMASAVARYFYAFIGNGTSERGSYELIEDWRHFLPRRGDLKASVGWLAHYVGLKRKVPDTPKYNPLQRFVYSVLVPASVVVMSLTGLALWASTCEIFDWVTNLLGGEAGVRAVHYGTMWALIGLTAAHVYAAVADGLGRIALMMFGMIPTRQRAERADT